MQETPAGHHYKKRRRRTLSPDEVAEIVAATKEPYRMHADVARQYRVSSQLVGTLVRESVRQPEKLEAQRQRVRLDEDRRDAI